MASRNSDGSVILKRENVRSARHNGAKQSIGRSDTDTIISRKDNTAFRLAKDGSTEIWVP